MAHTLDDLVQPNTTLQSLMKLTVLIDDARTPLIISGPTPEGERHEFDPLNQKCPH